MYQERYAVAEYGSRPLPDAIHTADGCCHETRWQPKFADPGRRRRADDADLWAWWMVPSAGRVAMDSLDTEWLWSAQAREEMRGLYAVDFFCDDPGESDPDRGALDELAVEWFLEFVRALTAAREGASTPCRVTVVTRRAAFDAASPRSATLWSAVRAFDREIDAGIDLRLVDVGEPTDLTALRWLARHDVREPELAVRDGRLYAPRLVTLADGVPQARVAVAIANP